MATVEKVKFSANIPEVVALKFPNGIACTSPYDGDQVLFTLVDGRRMYLPPVAAEKIHAAGIGAFQDFEICKVEKVHGNRRIVEFDVKPVPMESLGAVPAKNTAPFQRSSGSEPSIAPAPSATSRPGVLATLRVSGIAAIDAALEAEAYAQSKGMTDFVFGAENIQKVWMSAFIELCRNGGRA